MEEKEEEACKIVSEELYVSNSGEIYYSEDNFQDLPTRLKEAVYFLCNEYNYILLNSYEN